MKPAALVLIAALSAACGPHVKYTPPKTEPAPAFRELAANWKTAQPTEATVRGPWWELFGDPRLDALEERITVSNHTLRAAEASFAQARAAVQFSRVGLGPQVRTSSGASSSSLSGNRASSTIRGTNADFIVQADVSYEIDVWGRVRGTIEASRATAQASAADLEAISLSLHAELAIAYFALRASDTDRALLDRAVATYGQALELTQNRFRGGIAAGADVAQAETQLQTARAQSIDVQVQRAQLEHAIGVLAGQSASTFSLPAAPLSIDPPQIPPGLPSELLERRPDIAAGERRVAAANAQVGVARTAYYPLLSLTGNGGFESASLGKWITGLSNFWTIGPAAVLSVFDAGRRRATNTQVRAAYQQTVESYQQVVLVAFREVEDSLAVLRILEEEARVQADAVAAAERSLALAENRYRGGVVSYLEVITAQNAALANQRTAAAIRARRISATVLLIKALGGGWKASELPLCEGSAGSV